MRRRRHLRHDLAARHAAHRRPHDRLRGIEGLLIQLEEQPPDSRPGAILVAATPRMRDVAHEATREALERLNDAHERYEERSWIPGAASQVG